jgi:hypothetical protein
MPHNLQDPGGMLRDILREVSPIVRWCIILGLVLGFFGYLAFCAFLFIRAHASPGQIVPARLLALLFIPTVLAAIVAGLTVGVAIEGIIKFFSGDRSTSDTACLPVGLAKP